MMRQCAWCLRLIDSLGERLSQRPLPKIYEASHGMCCVCGAQWMEQVSKPSGVQGTPLQNQNETNGVSSVETPVVEPLLNALPTATQLMFELQQRETEKLSNVHF